MTDNNHPITPPPKLLQEWCQQGHNCISELDALQELATEAARWGADQELNECCKWLPKLPPWSADDLRKHRRPKPPSLKELALQALYRFDDTEGHEGLTPEQIADDFVLIRRALESLPD